MIALHAPRRPARADIIRDRREAAHARHRVAWWAVEDLRAYHRDPILHAYAQRVAADPFRAPLDSAPIRALYRAWKRAIAEEVTPGYALASLAFEALETPVAWVGAIAIVGLIIITAFALAR